jgi:hypothetical protein
VPDTGRSGAGRLLASFNGLSDADDLAVLGGVTTPSDQGLCVGPAGALQGAGVPLAVAGDTSVIVEMVNDLWAVYSKDGELLHGPEGLDKLFRNEYFVGASSCNYDPATQTFFFTEIGYTLNDGVYTPGTDLAVMNANGHAAYVLDTRGGGGDCFPDFPQQGFDDDAFYITVNEFCGPQFVYSGAGVYALSKSQLVALSPAVNLVSFTGLLTLDGHRVYTLRPAVGDGTATEYLLSSFSYGTDAQPLAAAHELAFWQVTGDHAITAGSGTVTLTGRIIPSEPYAFPVPATSTGDGHQSGPIDFVIAESYLEPNDSRLEQVQFVSSNGPPRLYTSLNTALTVGNDPTPVDGAAWFEINPGTGEINHQGYVGVAGTHLLYPSIVRSGSGTLVMGFSMTSPTLAPSTGYVLSKNQGNAFSPVRTTAEGSGPHVSYSPFFYGRHRWGDDSVIALDPTDGSVWLADQYVPPIGQGGENIYDNWGTRIWGLQE